MNLYSRLTLIWLCVLAWMPIHSLFAHEPFESTAEAWVHADSVEMKIGMARASSMLLLDESFPEGTKPTPENFDSMRPQFLKAGENLYRLTFNGETLTFDSLDVALDDEDGIDWYLSFPCVGGGTLTLRASYLEELPPQYGSSLIVNGENAENGPLLVEFLDISYPEANVEIPEDRGEAVSERASSTFVKFLELGVEHILIGYDHLLFLFGLLIVCKKFSSTALVITCFTIAHSITLALAALDFVSLPGNVVEPLIALSIVYVGVENFFRHGGPKGRWMLTFSFGLIHGFGFAGVLKEIGMGSTGASYLVSLFSFNLGVEIGQIAVAALILPVLWYLRNFPKFVKFGIPAASVLVAAMGAYWFVQRVFS